MIEASPLGIALFFAFVWLVGLMESRGAFDLQRPRHLRRQKARALARGEVSLKELFEQEEKS